MHQWGIFIGKISYDENKEYLEKLLLEERSKSLKS